jgi:hypothetical protein
MLPHPNAPWMVSCMLQPLYPLDMGSSADLEAGWKKNPCPYSETEPQLSCL